MVNERIGLKIFHSCRQFRFDNARNHRRDPLQFSLVGANHDKLWNSGLQTSYDFAGFIVLSVGAGDFTRDDEAVSLQPYIYAGLAFRNGFFNGAAETKLFRCFLDSFLNRLVFRPASSLALLARRFSDVGDGGGGR